MEEGPWEMILRSQFGGGGGMTGISPPDQKRVGLGNARLRFADASREDVAGSGVPTASRSIGLGGDVITFDIVDSTRDSRRLAVETTGIREEQLARNESSRKPSCCQNESSRFHFHP
jgi:hypothetical protein